MVSEDVRAAFMVRHQVGPHTSCAVPIQLGLLAPLTTTAECRALARSIMRNVPLAALPLIEGVRVQAGDAGGMFSVYDLVRELCEAKSLTFGIHMAAFWRALLLTIVRRVR